MSQSAYDRAIARATYWSPFVWSFPFDNVQTTGRTIIFGLYAGSYLNLCGYLQEIESDDLSNLLNDYNMKLAELSADEQKVLLDILTKRYIAGIEKLIHDEKMKTKSLGIEADESEWDAKVAALAADQAALETMHAKVATEMARNAAKIAELQSYIAIEEYNSVYVDIEIAEKELQAAKLDIEKLRTQNEILKLQLDIVNSAMGLANVDEEIARTKISMANLSREQAKMALYPQELVIEKAKTSIAQAEIPIAVAKVALAEAKGLGIDREVTFYNTTLVSEEAIDLHNKKADQDLHQHIRLDELELEIENKELDIANRIYMSALEVTFANLDKDLRPQIDGAAASVTSIETSDHRLKLNAALSAAQTMAAAKITTVLTHTIGVAE